VGADKLDESGAIYTGARLGEDAVRRTVELLKLTEEETAKLNQKLARLSVW
jgi:hypothetical protein